jgi:hypothetical protein
LCLASVEQICKPRILHGRTPRFSLKNRSAAIAHDTLVTINVIMANNAAKIAKREIFARLGSGI